MKETKQIIEKIKRFVPTGEDDPDTNEVLLDNILDDLFKNENANQVIPTLFELIEKYPEADLGAPGPIVHTLENFDGQYEDHLFSSLNKKPAPSTVLMLNRIINALIDPIVKSKCIDLMHQVSISENANKMAKKDAKMFYDYQMKIKADS